MLYAKINPTVKSSKRNSLFETETIESLYMTAYARPYGIGSSVVNFDVVFGNITNNKFEKFFNSNVKMTSEEIALWGTDDSVILSDLAKKLGTSAIEFITISDERNKKS